MAPTQSQPNKHDETSLQTQMAAPQGTEVTVYNISISVVECADSCENIQSAPHHVHWAHGIPAQCQKEAHNLLQKILSPPPKPCDDIAPDMAEKDQSLMAKVTKMHPMTSLEAKRKDLLHSKRLHSGKLQSHGGNGS